MEDNITSTRMHIKNAVHLQTQHQHFTQNSTEIKNLRNCCLLVALLIYFTSNTEQLKKNQHNIRRTCNSTQ